MLTASSPSAESQGRRRLAGRRRWVAAVALVACALLAAAAAVLLGRGDGGKATSAAPATRRIAVGGVHGVASGDGSVWAAIYRGRSVVRVPRDGRRASAHRCRPAADDPVVDRSSIWVPILGREQLAEIDTATNRVVRRAPRAFSAVAAGFGSVWVTEWRGAPRRLERWYGRDVARIDPRTGHVLDVVRPGGTLLDVGTGFGSVWPRISTVGSSGGSTHAAAASPHPSRSAPIRATWRSGWERLGDERARPRRPDLARRQSRGSVGARAARRRERLRDDGRRRCLDRRLRRAAAGDARRDRPYVEFRDPVRPPSGKGPRASRSRATACGSAT